MRLSLNGWPPVASHMTALLVGMSLAHLSLGSQGRGEPPPPKLPAKTLILALPSGARPGGGTPWPRPGNKVHLVRPALTGDSVGPRSCRLTDEPLTLLAAGSQPLLAASPEAVASLSVVALQLDPLRQGTVRLEALDPAGPRPTCSPEPKVIYETP